MTTGRRTIIIMLMVSLHIRPVNLYSNYACSPPDFGEQNIAPLHTRPKGKQTTVI